MQCDYCGENSDKLVREHLVPVSLGGSSYKRSTKTRMRNIFFACKKCDRQKVRAAFWSLPAIQEFFKIKKKISSYNFAKFLRDKTRLIIGDPNKQKMLCTIFDDQKLHQVTGDKHRPIFLSILFFLFLPGFCFAHPIAMDAICQIESNCTDDAVGKNGELGRYQISPIVFRHYQNADSHPKKVFLLPEIMFKDVDALTLDDLKNSQVNRTIANWYFNWLYDRCWTTTDTIIAWNFGIGNWRKWTTKGADFKKLPKTTQAYLKKYEQLTEKVAR